MDFVQRVLSDVVVVHCVSEELRLSLQAGGAEEVVEVPYVDKVDLARVLTGLQSLRVPFVSAGPNPPSDVSEFLRDEGLVTGAVRGVIWRTPNDPVIIEP